VSEYGLTAKQLAEFCASPPEPEEDEELDEELEEEELGEEPEGDEEPAVTPDLGTIGQNLFYSFLPDSPDACISIFDTGGWPKDPDFPRKDVTFQFRIRGTTYDEAQALAKKLHDYFCPGGIPKKCFNIGSFFIQLVLPMQPVPYYMGRDENGRDEFTWNMTFIIR